MASPTTLRKLRLQRLDKGSPPLTEAVQASCSTTNTTYSNPPSTNINTIFSTPSVAPSTYSHPSSTSCTTSHPSSDTLQLYVRLPSREISSEQLRAFILCQYGITVSDIFINTKEQKYQTGGVNEGISNMLTALLHF